MLQNIRMCIFTDDETGEGHDDKPLSSQRELPSSSLKVDKKVSSIHQTQAALQLPCWLMTQTALQLSGWLMTATTCFSCTA
jgi:hypothetical protein